MEVESQEWKLYFDGVANKKVYGVDILLVYPNTSHTPLAINLNFEATNNIAEYEASIIRLEEVLELDIEK